jgi:hypothetical protein
LVSSLASPGALSWKSRQEAGGNQLGHDPASGASVRAAVTTLQTVSTAISRFVGVRVVEADLIGGLVTVTADRPVNRADLAAAIIQAGYTWHDGRPGQPLFRIPPRPMKAANPSRSNPQHAPTRTVVTDCETTDLPGVRRPDPFGYRNFEE